MTFKRMAELELRGKRVFIRADLNVPQDEAGRITDDTRIRASVPGIRLALEKGAAVMVTSHLGRPKEGKFEEKDSLAPIAKRLAELLGFHIELIRNWTQGVKVEPGKVVLLENCRFNVGEKADDEALAKKIAALCDVYVNDAFGTAHRAEATTHGVARFAKVACAGPLMAAELDALTKALANPKRPLVAIVAGSKVSTKLTILAALATKVDRLIVGGGILNTFLLAAGLQVGKSLAEKDLAPTALRILEKAEAANCAIILPVDATVAFHFAANSPSFSYGLDAIPADGMILDVGPQSIARIHAAIDDAATLVWNGPLGAFEMTPFDRGTVVAAKHAAERTRAKKLISVAGGGDTVAALNQAGVAQDFSYVSTAGGAFLEWMEGKPLPGVEVLKIR